ncbi:MAG: hypothetical protein H7A23_24560 [Leptospiraceae bacterium]|nr:hypothetical protein [Leptospiraceae bacterium]MCP5497738.1 hypothetical protein [Leptospiraceae bacterium]
MSSKTKKFKPFSKLMDREGFIFDFIFVCLTFLVVAVMFVTGYSYYKNSNAILVLSEDLIDQINKRVIQNTKNYLFTAVDMTELSSRVAGEGVDSLLSNQSLSSLMIAVLRLHPQLNMFNIGNEQGDFLMQKRMEDGTIATKLIDHATAPKVTWTYRNKNGDVVSTDVVEESYDPRARPWYKGAKQAGKLFWSDVYIFNTGKVPGITASSPVYSGEELKQLKGVFGLDIPLIEISDFLNELRDELKHQKISDSATVYIVNSKDEIVAYPDIKQPMILEGDKFRPRRVSELEMDPPIIPESYNEYKRLKNQTKFNFKVEGKKYIASYIPFPKELEKDWTIGLVVPEKDLIGPIKETNRMNFTISLVILLAAMGLAIILNRLKKALQVRNRFIREIFGKYLSDDIVNSILESPKGLVLGGEKRVVTIMMTDLRGFTSISERLPAESCVGMINVYLDIMTEVILKYHGTIDEFIGDAILVIFGAPIQRDDDAKRAVACALEMQQAMRDVNQKNKELGYPEVQMGIGINTGDIVVGNIGSSKRMKYGVVGSNVNLTSRIESYTVGGQILVSQSTIDSCGPILRIDDQMEVMPKGVKEPITISEIGGIGGEFDVYLPEKEQLKLKKLTKPILVEFIILAGKHASTDTHKAQILSIADREAAVQTSIAIEKLNNLKVSLLNEAGEIVAADMYAKVMGNEEGASTYRINFTSIPQEAKIGLEELLKIHS